jgi:hypothetical protein
MRLYGRAFALDSNFVQAGFGLVSTNYWIGDAITLAGRWAGPAVWRSREQLSDGDRALLLAIPWVGPNYPLPSSFAELIDQAEAGVNGSPDSPEHWLLLGQLLARQGGYSGIHDWADRATQALDRAITLDSSFAMALQMRLFVALLQDDPEDIRRIAAAYESHGATEFSGDLMLWGAAVKLGDSVKTIEWRDRFEEFSQQNLYSLPMHSIRLGLPLGDAHRALAVLRDLAATRGEISRGSLGEVALAFVEGRVQDAVAGIEASTAWLPAMKNSYAISTALFEAPYREAAMDVAARVAAVYPNVGPLPPATGITEYQWPVLNDCHGELLRVVQGDTSRTRQAIRRLRNMTEESPLPATLEVPSTTLEHGQVVPLDRRTLAELFVNSVFASARIFPVCPLLLEVMLDGPARLDALDSLMQTGPQGANNMVVPAAFANLVIAQLRETQGDIDGALAAVRRRSKELNPGFLWNLPVLLRQEGRLAAMVGDTTGAIRAYEHYLTLRTNPDQPLLPQRDSVVAELAALEGQ